MQTSHNSEMIGTVVGGCYQLEKILGKGGLGTTYCARDMRNDQQVAIKVVTFKAATAWKALELIERETKVLKNLQHPAIPTYLDAFEDCEGSRQTFYLVQELAPGCSLAQWIEQGWQPSQKESVAIAEQMLEILCYLQSLTPPVIHRDIKPENIIRNEHDEIYLVDFGSIQDTYRHTITGGSTIVGTFGYMAPEQCRGQATLATDLYGLGATLVFLLTGKCPSELPEKKFKIDFRTEVRKDIGLDRFTAQWIDSLIEPVLEQRLTDAQAAMRSLKQKQPLPKVGYEQRDRFRIERTPNYLVVEVFGQGLHSKRLQWWVLATAIVTITTGFALYWLSAYITGPFFQALRMRLLAIHVLTWISHAACLHKTAQGSRLILSSESVHFWQYLWLKPVKKKHNHRKDSVPPLIAQPIGRLQYLRLKEAFRPTFKNTSMLLDKRICAMELKIRGRAAYSFGNHLPAKSLCHIIEEVQLFLEDSTELSDPDIRMLIGEKISH